MPLRLVLASRVNSLAAVQTLLEHSPSTTVASVWARSGPGSTHPVCQQQLAIVRVQGAGCGGGWGWRVGGGFQHVQITRSTNNAYTHTQWGGYNTVVEPRTRDRKVAGSNPSRSGGRMLFSGASCADSNFAVRYTPVLPQQHVKDPGHSAKSAGGRLQLNTHAPYICGFA